MKNTYLLFSLWLTITFNLSPLAAQDSPMSSSTVAQAERPETLLQNKQRTTPNPVFVFSLQKDLPILAGSGAMAIGGILLMEEVTPLNEADLAALDPSSVNAFDRGATRQYRVGDGNISDYLLTLGAVSPLSVLASKGVRREFAPILVMYVETAALVGGLTSISKGFFKRKRPFAYNPNALMSDRLSTDARHSFFSGHVSTSAAFCFFTAYMVNRYAEQPGWKLAGWTGAVLIPGTIGYLRYTSGNHFPTDILVGYIIGAGTGILIPSIHRWQLPEDVAFHVQPVPSGVLMTLTF